jgi:hypothetical protein
MDEYSGDPLELPKFFWNWRRLKKLAAGNPPLEIHPPAGNPPPCWKSTAGNPLLELHGKN